MTPAEAEKKTELPRKYCWKQLIFDIHLWLGLASGIVVSILCLSGAYLALQPTLEAWLNRDLYQRRVTQPAMGIQELLEAVDDGTRYTSLEIPNDEQRHWSLRAGRQAHLVEPATGEFLDPPRPFLKGSYRLCFRLHRWLLLEKSTGRTLTGASTVIFIISLLTGVVLWFQKTRKNRKRGLLLRRGVSWKRFNYDTHLVLGLYATLPLLMMALSGLFWSYRAPFVSTVYRVLDGGPPPKPQKRAKQDEESSLNYKLPYQKVREYCAARFPEPGTLRIYFPSEGEPTFRVIKQRQAGLGVLPVRDELYFSTVSGEAEKEVLYQDKTSASKLLSLIKSIHTGEFNGAFSIFVYLVCCVFGASLPVSGALMWWNRIRGRLFRKSDP